jgi:hypothetical protein
VGKPSKKPDIAPRKPPRTAPAALDSFVEEGRASRSPSAQAPRSPGKRTPIVRADGRELRKLHVYVAASTARALAVHCAEIDADQSAVVQEALSRYLMDAGRLM